MMQLQLSEPTEAELEGEEDWDWCSGVQGEVESGSHRGKLPEPGLDPRAVRDTVDSTRSQP